MFKLNNQKRKSKDRQYNGHRENNDLQSSTQKTGVTQGVVL
jgi:hypothetical protein